MNIHLPTRPNIPLEILKFRAGGILLLIAIGVCALLLIYLLRRILKVIIIYRRNIQKHLQFVQSVRKKYLDELQQLQGRDFVIRFLSYLERYGSQQWYASLEEMLIHLWIGKEKVEQITLLYYSQRGDEVAIANFLKSQLESA